MNIVVTENKVPLKSVKYGRVVSFISGDTVQYCIKAYGSTITDEGKCLLVNLKNGSLWELPKDEMVNEYLRASLNLTGV